MTEQEIKNLDTKKIFSIRRKVGKLASLTVAKYFKCSLYNNYVIVTREGILNFFGDAQKAQIYGKKGKDYKEFKTARATAKYLNTIKI